MKARGSTKGILHYQSEAKKRTRLALETALNSLLSDMPNSRWTNALVCRRAGLESTVSLKKPWNQDLLERIHKHNQCVSLPIASNNQSPHAVDKADIKDFQRLFGLVKRLRQSLRLREAELNALENENRALKNQLRRLREV